MLVVVPTPIGNLGDMTHRALETLKSVDIILAEDTRTSGRLLSHFGIDTALRSFHAHNEHAKLSKVIDSLQNGQKIALITDAGMPGISDPGYLLIREVIRENIQLEILPGPSAFVLALLHSGFPNHIFQFAGFMPQKKGRLTAISNLLDYPHTSVIYESPYRIVKLLKQIGEIDGKRPIAVSRELTKLHETTIRGTAHQLLEMYDQGETIKGEYTVVIGPKNFEL